MKLSAKNQGNYLMSREFQKFMIQKHFTSSVSKNLFYVRGVQDISSTANI